MNAEPEVGMNNESLETDRQAATMRDQLSKEVASWSKERKQQSSEPLVAPVQPTTQRRSPRHAAKSATPAPLSVPGKPAGAGAKPFRMSYGGMSQAEYSKYLYDRGFR